MATVEKLLVQIFERKNWIIEQVKQQTELYDQHLASKLLVHGVTPPPWLWNPNPSSHSTQLNKEELISELLLPHPWHPVHYPTAHYSHYRKPVVRDYPEVSNGFCTETHASNKDFDVGEGEGPSMVVGCHDIGVENNLSKVPELDGSVSSPVDQVAARISNIYSAPDQSLARIQRSKSRQKALELRNSAKSGNKSHPRNEGKNDGSSGGIRLSGLDSEVADHYNEAPKLPEPCAISSQIGEDREKNVEDGESLGQGSNLHAVRITRSESSGKCLSQKESSAREFKASERGCNVHMVSSRKSRSSRKIIGDIESNEGDSQSKETGKDIDAGRTTRSWTSGVSCRTRETDEGNGRIEERGIDTQAGKSTTPKSSTKQASYVCDPLTVYASADVIPEKDLVDRTSVIAQKNDVTQIGSMDDLTQQPCCASGPLEFIELLKLSEKNCAVKEAVLEDGFLQNDEASNVYCGQITRFNSSSGQNDCINLASEPNRDSSFLRDRGIVPVPCGIVQENDNCNESSVVVRISDRPLHKRTRSENSSCNEQTSDHANNSSASSRKRTLFKLSAEEKFVAAGSELQNASGCQVIPDSHSKIEQQEIGDTIVANELETDKIVEDQSFSYNSDYLDANLRRGLECLAARPPSDCFMLVKPKQLDFDSTEDLNETLGLTVERKRLEKEVCSTLLEAASSPDKERSSDNKVAPTEKKSPVMPKVSSEVREHWTKSIEFNVAGDVKFQMTRDEPITDEHSELKNMNNDSEPACRQNSPYMKEADVILPNACETPDSEINKSNAPSKQGCESSRQQHAEGGECRCEGKERSATCSYASRRKHSVPTIEAKGDPRSPLAEEVVYGHSTCIEPDANHKSFSNKFMGRSPHLGRNGSLSGSAGSAGISDKIPVPEARELRDENIRLSPETISKSYKAKRRKTENQQVDCCIASSREEVQKFDKDLKDVRCSSDPVLGDFTIGNKSPEVTMKSNVKHHQTENIGSLPEDQRDKDGLDFAENNNNPENLLAVTENSEVSLVSRLTPEAARDIQGGCLVEATTAIDASSISPDARMDREEQMLNLEYKDYLLDHEKSAYTERHLLERKSVPEEDHLLPQCSVQCPQGKDLKLFDDDQTMSAELACAGRNLLERKSILDSSVQSANIEDLDIKDAKQTMPVFEGFIIDPQSENKEWDVTGNIINIDKLELPRSTIARASILEQICKSASVCTPLSHLSSALESHRYQYLFRSVPNGLLEQTDLQAVQFLNEDPDNEFLASLSNVNEANSSLQRMPYSDYFPGSGTQFGLTPVKQYTSPLSKIWESFSSKIGSSGTRFSSNPELTCFPIEEDPSIIDGNETADEDGDEIQEDIDLLVENNAKREHETSIAEVRLNPPASVSAVQEFLSRGSVDTMNTEASFTRTHSKVKRKVGNSYRNKGEGKENQIISSGAIGTMIAKASLNNRYSRPKLSSKASLRNEPRKLQEKEPKCNNIVSNVTSFIPLVKQKQAAEVCTGKREIKVKALEAAEAAKRLEEKRDNERKAKKEALKLERAKMEQENAKQAELEKKKKEEERRRKGADMAARKRQREEEERKEKERKRKRIEETQRQRKEQEDKLRTQKVDKDKLRSDIDGKIMSKQESENELKNCQAVDKERGDDINCKKLETEPSTAATAATNPQQASISSKECIVSSKSCDKKQVVCTLENFIDTGNFVREKTVEKSYEISPYQCSDNEDEEVDDLPTKKFIPQWASKNSVAMALPLQQELDPDLIFPLESFCSMDEVLLPRSYN